MVDLGPPPDDWKKIDKELEVDALSDSDYDPYLSLAKREAEDDQLLGIERNEEWISNRARSFAKEDLNRKESDPKKINKKGRWIDREKLIEELDKTLEGKYGNKEKNWLASWQIWQRQMRQCSSAAKARRAKRLSCGHSSKRCRLWKGF